MKNILIYLLVICNFSLVFSQETGSIKGKVIDVQTRETLPFVNIIVEGTNLGTSTDKFGMFVIKNVPLGYVKIEVSFLGYQTKLSDDYLVTIDKTPYIFIELLQGSEQLSEVVIQSKLFKKSVESPLSVQSLGIAEIEKNPGGNRDVLKVIQSLPGVASNPGFRNDIIIRGGAPSENKFYLDGIEVPVINHFQTQGSSGGPVGIINADLIRKVDFYTSAFTSNRGNSLSSIIEFTQKEGNPEKLNTRATFGTSDAGLTLDGPLSDKTTFIASVRQSYLQFLFKLIKLPFLPTYNDFQFKVNHQLSSNSEIAIIGLGAIDNFKLNESVNKNVIDEETIKRNRYILSNIPVQEQWNYTIGANYKHYSENTMQQIVFSRNEWSNNAKKYFNNTNNPTDLLLDYSSKEVENKLRFENTSTLKNNYKLNVGVGLENAKYTNTTFQQISNASGVSEIDFTSELSMLKYAVFGQISKSFNTKLGISAGLRLDAVDYNSEMQNPLNQFSPRVSLSYKINDKLSLNVSSGIYKQLPAYTIMGYRNNLNELVNKNNSLKFIQATHYVSGFELNPNSSSKITFEGFYKKYKNYPFSVRDQISLANLGSDFGVIGNEEVTSNSKGKSYGFELLAQKKSYSGLYGILSYTFVKSEFKDKLNNYIPSSWDNRHLLTVTGGKKLLKNWEIGAKFRLVGGQPYTPYNFEVSSIITNYDVSNSGILDYNKLNSERFNTYNQLDIRVDKTWYWKKLSLNFYFDVQNVYGSKSTSQSYLIPLLDENGNKQVSTSDNTKYNLEAIENTSGNVLPRFGVIFDF
ncbi:outer membrane receptor protein involved in Fe transport [Lutibacter oceani]|uniref:Outer membrane receptor protein involved in Fe transport n=1 Tax=Lutibacter oceani TaxID=1853311 RepID=A0A3D9RS75_9FLAO|nr:TonB-dependent receptor [Lutibacter oceani]REE80006.1 outer membrane receptor protein involved in Fe transport [Lutibacter oceani]